MYDNKGLWQLRNGRPASADLHLQAFLYLFLELANCRSVHHCIIARTSNFIHLLPTSSISIAIFISLH